MNRYLACIAILLAIMLNTATPAQGPGAVWVISIEGAIGPATSDYVLRGFNDARAADAGAIVIQMNTPGGLDNAMRDIIQAILASEIPIITFVSPQGARAASAGTYISYAAHVAAMAPATNLGAATPVQLSAPNLPEPGETEDSETATSGSSMEKKMINDAAAYIRGLAELRGRNAEWAELAVREAASLDAPEALEAGVIDLVADDLDDLLNQLDGMIINIADREMTLATRDVELHFQLPDWRTEILSIITNPSIVLILGMIGFYGIILEFYNPGSLIPGVIGVICLLVAAYSVQLLPLNYAGLALLLLGIGLMVAEAMVPSFGILGIGGVIAFSIGGLMLFDTDMEAFQVGIPTIAATATVSALLIIATINIAMRIRKKRVTTGIELLVGETGLALSDLDHEGQVRVGAEIWHATASSPVRKGEAVTIEAIDGLKLRVTPQAATQEGGMQHDG